MNFEERATLELEEQRILIEKLTPYGFRAPLEMSIGRQTQARLELGPATCEVEFRVRDLEDGIAACSFVNLEGTEKNLIRRFLAARQRDMQSPKRFIDESTAGSTDEQALEASPPGIVGGRRANETAEIAQALEERQDERSRPKFQASSTPHAASVSPVTDSRVATLDAPSAAEEIVEEEPPDQDVGRLWSDELPLGELDSTDVNDQHDDANDSFDQNPYDSTLSEVCQVNPPPSTRRRWPVLIGWAIGLLALAGFVGLAWSLLGQASQFALQDAKFVASEIPVKVNQVGRVAEVLVTPGQKVARGDRLVVLRPAVESVPGDLDTKRENARLKLLEERIGALIQQRESFLDRRRFIEEKLNLELAATESNLKSVERTVEASAREVQRLRPFVESGAVTRKELANAEQLMRAKQASREAIRKKLQSIAVSLQAAEENILTTESGSASLATLDARLRLAEAERDYLTRDREGQASEPKPQVLLAPCDGIVGQLLCQPDSQLAAGAVAIVLQPQGTKWVRAQLAKSQLGKAWPGQPVRVELPQTGQTFAGVLATLGGREKHAQVESRNDESRSFNLDSIQVEIYVEGAPADIPIDSPVEVLIESAPKLPWLRLSTAWSFGDAGK